MPVIFVHHLAGEVVAVESTSSDRMAPALDCGPGVTVERVEHEGAYVDAGEIWDSMVERGLAVTRQAYRSLDRVLEDKSLARIATEARS
jgi:hypothetical protein